MTIKFTGIKRNSKVKGKFLRVRLASFLNKSTHHSRAEDQLAVDTAQQVLMVSLKRGEISSNLKIMVKYRYHYTSFIKFT